MTSSLSGMTQESISDIDIQNTLLNHASSSWGLYETRPENTENTEYYTLA